MTQFVFVYGSLINSESRQKSGVSALSHFPALVKGYQRGWFQRIESDKCSALGLIQRTNSFCHGIILEVTEQELNELDNRELPHGYKRTLIPTENLTSMDEVSNIPSNVWVYYTDSPQTADRNYPIIQSYLDVIITGCLAYGKDFTNNFIETTKGWGNSWVDDRKNPIYRRNMAKANKELIDQCLAKVLPNRKQC